MDRRNRVDLYFVFFSFLFGRRYIIEWIPPVESGIHCILFCGGEQEKSSGFRIPLEYCPFQWIPVESDWCERTLSVTFVSPRPYLYHLAYRCSCRTNSRCDNRSESEHCSWITFFCLKYGREARDSICIPRKENRHKGDD
jgi:hypothetical protein